MAKKKNHHQSKQKRSSAEKDEERRLTLEAIEAMSDDSDDDDDQVGGELNTKAKNLRDAIASGKFDGILDKLNSAMNDEESGEEFEEDVLGASDDEEDAGDVEDSDSQKGENCDDGEEEEAEEMDNDEDEAHAKAKEFLARVDEASSDEEEDDDGDHSKNDVVASKAASRKESNDMNAKALAVAVTELRAEKAGMPWAETFAIIPSTPLPFGENGDPESNPLDIHDDLKREVAFYNSALEAIKDARVKCTAANIPFSRPEDFFAEMVKTDDHMAKIKDRLIFENKKIEAVAQRRSNKEQKLRAKESRANKLAEKAKRKKEHFKDVEEWANSAAKNRSGVLQDDDDNAYLERMGRGGVNAKRQRADKKFGFGGKRGRFKQNDRKTLNDTSSFNPRGNFVGGMKRSAKNGAGASRPGKRARDARRSRG